MSVKRNIKKMALAAMLAGMLGSLTGCFIQPDPTLDPLQISDGTVPFGTVQALPTNTPTPGAAEHGKPHAGHVAIQRPEHVGGLVERQSADNHAQNGGDCRAGRAKLADLHTGLQRGLSRAARRLDGQRRQRFAGAADRAGLLHRNDRRQILHRHAEGRYGVPKPKRSHGGRHCGPRDAGQALFRVGAAKTVSASTTESGYTLLKEGASGLEVRKLQGRLAELGYYAGGVDGIYGSTTTSAVKAFQRANGLSGDGQAGTQTQTKLYSANAKYATSPVTTANPDQTRTLSVGMTGNDVYALQERLIELNYLSGVADGVFGTETQNALIAFQNRNGLTADGTGGRKHTQKTERKLQGGDRDGCASSNGTLHEGDSGEDVYNLQARLFELGYYNGRIDGRYSSETTAAVKAFQKANGLSADGIAGQGTLNKLNSGNAVVSDGTTDDVTGDETDDEPTATYQPTTAYTVLRRGDKSDQVQVMQRYLATLGYLNSTPDGQFGSATERAVKLFQEANGLSADGVAGSGTLSILYGDAPVSYNAYFGSSGNGASGGTTTVAPTPVPDMTTVIQWESEGDNVRQYQQRLVELGYLDSKSVTGKFNQKTVEATKAFQTMNDLKVDGAAGPQSLKLIYSGDALDANGVRVGDKLGSASDTVTVSDVLTAG